MCIIIQGSSYAPNTRDQMYKTLECIQPLCNRFMKHLRLSTCIFSSYIILKLDATCASRLTIATTDWVAFSKFPFTWFVCEATKFSFVLRRKKEKKKKKLHFTDWRCEFGGTEESSVPRSASLAWGRGASWARKSVRSLKNCLSPKLHIVNVAEAKKLFITWLHPLDRADDRSHKGILTPQ